MHVCYLCRGDDRDSSYDFSLVGDLFHGPKYLLGSLCVGDVALAWLRHLTTQQESLSSTRSTPTGLRFRSFRISFLIISTTFNLVFSKLAYVLLSSPAFNNASMTAQTLLLQFLHYHQHTHSNLFSLRLTQTDQPQLKPLVPFTQSVQGTVLYKNYEGAKGFRL